MNNTKELQDSLQEVSVVMRGLKQKIPSNKKFIKTLLHIFCGVSDFRQPAKIKYRLENILCMFLLIALRGRFTSFLAASEYIKYNADYFKKFGLLDPKEIPSHDTLRRIFMNIDANELRDCLINRIGTLIKKIVDKGSDGKTKKIRLLSGDGKTFNGSGRKGNKAKNTCDKRNCNVFNFFDASSALCHAVIPLDDKDSEIPTFQKVLNKFNLKDTMITADALHCQRKTVEIINKKGGLYCIKVKDNQPGFKQHIIDVIKLNQSKCVRMSFNNCDYEIFIIDYKTNELDFPGAKAYIRMNSHKRKDQADYNPEDQYFVSSADNPQLIMEAIDNRWAIESGLHWWKDDFLKEDECIFTDKNAIKVMATLNNIAYGIYRLGAAIFNDHKMSATRIQFQDEPEKLLEKLVPLMEKQNLTMLLKQNMRGGRKKNSK